MSPVLGQDELRADYAPKCEHHDVPGLTEAWLVVGGSGGIMEANNYAPRDGETYAANCRAVTGGAKESMHALFGKGSWLTWTGVKVNTANATDFNSTTNPYGLVLHTDMPRVMVDAILAVRTNSGVQVFQWGGYFSAHKDAMHFEICCSKADLATGIDMATVAGVIDVHSHEKPKPQLISGDDDMLKIWSTRYDDPENGEEWLEGDHLEPISGAELDELLEVKVEDVGKVPGSVKQATVYGKKAWAAIGRAWNLKP